MKSSEKSLPLNSNQSLGKKPPPVSPSTFRGLLKSVWIKMTQMTYHTFSNSPRESRKWCRVVASAMEGPIQVSILEQFFRSRANR